ncbi:MAG TPA: 2-C-methyl-D-erythritol 4-phosphate cytidylyltransferase, partial [Actinotalea sp.]|nr:2-C-methyl-D-erythritol 4-phosphate cytidylyltransferase [Actinotalea sp.]
MDVAVVLTAAGSGSRLGRDLPKALVPLGDRALVAHAAAALVAAVPTGRLAVLVVTAPAGSEAQVSAAVGEATAEAPVVVVTGRATRQGSVAAGLEVLGAYPEVTRVLVHDAARPRVPAAVVDRVLAALGAGHRAVVPGIPVTDTVKRVGTTPGAEGAEPVIETVPRGLLRAVQTPQGFDRSLLEQAHAAAAELAADEALAASDDAGLVERLGEQVWVVAGDERAAQITTVG